MRRAVPGASIPRGSDAEPAPLAGAIRFEEGDFHALSERLAADPQYNDRRLVTRRKLGALAKRAVERLEAEGLALQCRTSLHNPNTFNRMRVRRLWAYLCRPPAERRRLRGVIGSDLGKDLDAAYRNAYLCLAIESDALEVSLRVHPEGWYDGQNLKKRLAKDGPRMWLALLNQLDGHRLRLHDWKGEWRCGSLTVDQLEEYLRYYQPGEHMLAVERRFPAPEGNRGPALDAGVSERLVEELVRLAPIYRYAAWSRESDFLFAG